MTKLNEMHQNFWKSDVESFERWKAFYENASGKFAKRAALKQLHRLQSRWPNHKLGEMPK